MFYIFLLLKLISICLLFKLYFCASPVMGIIQPLLQFQIRMRAEQLVGIKYQRFEIGFQCSGLFHFAMLISQLDGLSQYLDFTPQVLYGHLPMLASLSVLPSLL